MNAVIKPHFPLILACALVLWLACALTYQSVSALDHLRLEQVCVCALMLSGIAAVCAVVFMVKDAGILKFLCRHAYRHKEQSSVTQEKRHDLRLVITLLVTFLCVGACAGSLGSYTYIQNEATASNLTGTFTFKLTSDTQSGDFGSHATARIEEGAPLYKVRINFKDDVTLYTGQTLRALSTSQPIGEKSREFSYREGIVAVCTIKQYDLVDTPFPLGALFSARIQAIEYFKTYGGASSDLLQALVCGYRNGVSDSGLYDSFKVCGLAHLIAVSGAHLAIVIATFGALLKAMRTPRKLTMVLCIIFIGSYLIFSGIPISAIRAAIMACLSLTSILAKRRNASLAALGLSIIFFITTDPASSVSASLYLSAASTLGIMLFARLFEEPFQNTKPWIDKAIGAPFSLTLSANVATLPYTAATFKTLSLVAPVANIVATPLFTIACAAGLFAALCALAIPMLAPVLISLAAFCALPLAALGSVMSQIPYAAVFVQVELIPMMVLIIALFCTLWFVWPHMTFKKYGACLMSAALVMVLGSVLPQNKDTEIAALDVGQGDAILLRSNTQSLLVDTGNQERKIAQELADCGIRSLDGVVITHPDDDHCGALSYLASYVEIDTVFVAQDMLDCSCDKCQDLVSLISEEDVCRRVCGLREGDSLACGDIVLEVIWPYSYVDEGGNSDSVCLMAHIDGNQDGVGDYAALLVGDAEADELLQIKQRGHLEDIDVLKVGHHGSRKALNEEVLGCLKPEIALISVGADNRYGHPAEEALELLDATHCEIARTDWYGRVTVGFNATGITLEYAHGKQ